MTLAYWNARLHAGGRSELGFLGMPGRQRPLTISGIIAPLLFAGPRIVNTSLTLPEQGLKAH